MASDAGYLLILDNGAGGYIAANDRNDACNRASHADGHGWVFRCKFDEHTSGRHRRSRPMVKLWLISALGRPNSGSITAALEIAGERHSVSYKLATRDHE